MRRWALLLALGLPLMGSMDADAQTRLIGFIGRDPDWRP